MNTKDKPEIVCNFCGKGKSEVETLIVSNDVGICNECTELCTNILAKEKTSKNRTKEKIREALDAQAIKSYLDEHIIGQDEAKVAISVAVVNHYKRVFNRTDIKLDKSNLLLFGPTGSGKTLLARTIADYLNVPFVITDATSLTEAGYVGEDVENVIERLLAEADFDVDKCEQGIVFIDEIDKIARKGESSTTSKDVSGEGVQQALLKLVEGTKCKVAVKASKKMVVSDSVEIDTRNILFIAGGAFVDLNKIVEKRMNANSIGFGSKLRDGNVDRSKIVHEDFVKFGMIPEFTGRFPVIVHTNDLTLDDYIAIMKEPKNNLLKQMQFYFNVDNIKLMFDSKSLSALAKEAMKLKVGARGLKAVIEKILQPYMFEISDLKQKGVKSITITDKVVTEDKKPIIKYESIQK
jgi:ATP-dependent Clp protease ATP-binding subunit ClpX